MKKFALIAIALIIVPILSACDTKKENKPPKIIAPSTPAEFFSKNGAKDTTKQITVGSGKVKVQFPQGTTLTFADNSLLKADGTAFSGQAKVIVREIRSKADMIFSNVLTVSNGAPLVSGGMFKLDVKTATGDELKINPAIGVGAQVPAVGPINKEDKMQKFVEANCPAGTEINCDHSKPAEGDSDVNWQPAGGKFSIDNTTTPGSYIFSVFGKGWFNCDFFYRNPAPKTTLHVSFDPINDANTILFMIPKSINTVISLYTKDGPNARKSYIKSLPIGLEAELVALTFNDGKQYLAHKSISIAETSAGKMETSLTFAEASDAEVKSFLGGLQ